MDDAKRLTRQQWIEAALQALAQRGAGAVRVEPLARLLSVSKGSFYWHFADLADLKTAMLVEWVRLATDEISASVAALGLPPRESLVALARAVATEPDRRFGGSAIEPAIRDWGRFDADVRRRVAEVDGKRIAFVAGLFEQAGFAPAMAARRGTALYATVLGFEHLRISIGLDMETAMLDLARGAMP